MSTPEESAPEHVAEEAAEAAPPEAEETPATTEPKKSALSLAGLGEAFGAVFGAILGRKKEREQVHEVMDGPEPGHVGETDQVMELAPAAEEPDGDQPEGEDPAAEVPEEEDDEEDGGDGEEAPASRPLVSTGGLLDAFRAITGGGAGRPAESVQVGPSQREKKEGLFGRISSWGKGKPEAAPAATPKSFGPPAKGKQADLPSLSAALGDTGALGSEAREAAAALLLGAPAAFASVEVTTGWPPPGKRPLQGPFWARTPAWLAATADAAATLRWPAATLDASEAEVEVGEAAWTGSRRGPVHVYSMGAAGVKEELRRQWHRDAFLAVGQSLDSALADAWERDAAPKTDRWETAQALLGRMLGKPIRLAGRAGLFGLGRHTAVEEGELDSAGAAVLLGRFTVPATIHLVLRHVRRSRAAGLAALVPAEARLDLGWPGLDEPEFPLVDGAFVAPRASLGEAAATLHPQRDLVTATGGAAWKRGADEGEAGWMLRLAIEAVVRREGWLEVLESEASAAWDALAGLTGSPRMVFEGERRWPWTESLIAEAGGEGRSDLASLADRVLSRVDLHSHATDGAQRPFGAHARETIRRVLLLT